MICVEVPVSKLVDEIIRLEQADGQHSQTYAKGAIAALRWVIDGDPRPSQDVLMLLKESPHGRH